MKQPEMGRSYRPTELVYRVTKEAREDCVIQPRSGWVYCYHDWNTDSDILAIWFLAPLGWLFWWWQGHRWMIERQLRWRISDLPSGAHAGYWFLTVRPIKQWTLQRTRPRVSDPAYKEIEMRWNAAILAFDKNERDKKLALLRHLFGPRDEC